MELYKKYRPKLFKDVIEQEASKTLHEFIKRRDVPHAILFSGPSGCGKTTLARILADKMKCSSYDLTELNAASFRGIDAVRSIEAKAGLAPVAGEVRVWIIDEAHQMTPAAQDCILKLLEDSPKKAYFFLATTDPGKLKNTIKTRTTHLKINLVSDAGLKQVIDRVLSKEKKELSEVVQDAIIENSEGSARMCLVLLDQALTSDSEEEQLSRVTNFGEAAAGIDIARALFDKRSKWTDITSKLKTLGEDPETVRYVVLGYAKAILNNRIDPYAVTVIEEFENSFYEGKLASLYKACAVCFSER